MSKEEPKIPEPFKPHPNLDDRINHAIEESELLGGVWLNKLEVGKKIKVLTQNRAYIIEKHGEDDYYISGHPKYCPIPTKTKIAGSKLMRDGSAIKSKFIGEGLYLEFKLPDYPRSVLTSEIKEVIVLPD